MSHVFDSGEIGRRMIGSDTALVVAEEYVHHPVEAVLDALARVLARPVAAYGRPDEMRLHHQ